KRHVTRPRFVIPPIAKELEREKESNPHPKTAGCDTSVAPSVDRSPPHSRWKDESKSLRLNRKKNKPRKQETKNQSLKIDESRSQAISWELVAGDGGAGEVHGFGQSATHQAEHGRGHFPFRSQDNTNSSLEEVIAAVQPHTDLL